MAVDDPRLMFPIVPGRSAEETRRWMVFSLWIAHWAMLWDIGALSPPALHRCFGVLFRDSQALTFWSNRGAEWSIELSRHRRAFLAIADEVHREAQSRHE
jgi:hypothetical protein